MMKLKLLFFSFFLLCSSLMAQQGTVYLVLGSDTGTWDGLDVSNYTPYIKGDLYTVPTRNGYLVMDDAFRDSFTDSYGGHLKLTWWMMSGNMFRLSVNANTPNKNSMMPYLMMKYHGDKIRQFGDEVSLHYHTFFWSDYNGDGIYYYNQAKTFNESREDFDFTLAQNLIDENLFPVSFRSGWHFMDNDWQNYLDKLLPFSMHNDYPSKKLVDPEEPLDNVIDWSQAPSTWAPFHPSADNYQLPGNLKGWDLRSRHIGASSAQKELDSMFVRANRGLDQMACFWGHLPEEDFLTNLKRIDSLVHISAKKFPNVKFRYCTAVEAMQRYLKTTDVTPPKLTVSPVEENGKIAFDITTDEDIFQAQPFFAVKDVYDRYTILNCTKTAQMSWRTDFTDKSILAKAGAAVTDLAGNLSKKLINFLPDDFFVDNMASQSIKVNSGSWSNVTDHSCFDISSLNATVDASAGASITVSDTLPSSGKYNLFVQFAKVDNSVDSLQVTILKEGAPVDTITLKGGLKLRSWIYLSTITASGITPLEIKISAGGKSQSGKVIAFDALKTSALVKDRQIILPADFADLGDIVVGKETTHTVVIENRGIGSLQITGAAMSGKYGSVNSNFPATVGSMQTYSFTLKVLPQELGSFSDTLKISSDDPVNPVIKMVIRGNSVNYFEAVDNDDLQGYKESGSWSYSVAKGYMSSSRFAYLNQKPGARAAFTAVLEKAGTYDFLFTVPATVNASNHALYVLTYGAKKDSFYVDQNKGSGSWVKVASRFMEAGTVKAEIIDAGGNTTSNAVLRSDAVRFNFVSDVNGVVNSSNVIPKGFALSQNYPNPFNPSTTIKYSLPRMCQVTLKVFDVLGTEVAALFNGAQPAGEYSFRFDPRSLSAGSLSSGIYFYILKAVPSDGSEPFTRTLKMMYLK
ncbi:MAG TPA: hypothetical protein VHO03_18830 [Ignavibacteriales bacterium]|nr:hypothetical protein [Ignavibacteriales bacterium]